MKLARSAVIRALLPILRAYKQGMERERGEQASPDFFSADTARDDLYYSSYKQLTPLRSSYQKTV
jgi:hypothetical protein